MSDLEEEILPGSSNSPSANSTLCSAPAHKGHWGGGIIYLFIKSRRLILGTQLHV